MKIIWNERYMAGPPQRCWRRGEVCPVGSAVRGWLFGVAACVVVAEQVAGLAVKRLADL